MSTSLAPSLWIECGDSSQNVNLLTQGSTVYPGLTTGKGMGCGEAVPTECVCA